jgi:hypothetical protein
MLTTSRPCSGSRATPSTGSGYYESSPYWVLWYLSAPSILLPLCRTRKLGVLSMPDRPRDRFGLSPPNWLNEPPGTLDNSIAGYKIADDGNR